MVEAILKEVDVRKDYLEGQDVETIYFGGGTPSMLPALDLEKILRKIDDTFQVVTNPEITLEGNPDDLSEEKLRELFELGINRLSIGIQTFDETALKFMNRSHSSEQALTCLENAENVGFKNYSADLIFAVPPEGDSFERFHSDLNSLTQFKPPHISLYSLTIEEKTVFGRWFDKQKLDPVSEDENASQYELAIQFLTDRGYDHYEVSNFGRPDMLSRHNSSYWKAAWYLGLGPSAHSFNGSTRSINVANNANYMKALEANNVSIETESLSATQKLNEYILTGIRTKWGIDLKRIEEEWGMDFAKQHDAIIGILVKEKKATLENGIFRLNSTGFSIADELALQFFSEE